MEQSSVWIFVDVLNWFILVFSPRYCVTSHTTDILTGKYLVMCIINNHRGLYHDSHTSWSWQFTKIRNMLVVMIVKYSSIPSPVVDMRDIYQWLQLPRFLPISPALVQWHSAVETDCILLSGSHGAAVAEAVAVPNVRINLILLRLIGRMGLFWTIRTKLT